MSRGKRWNIPVSDHLDNRLEEYIEKDAYKTKSEFVRTAVRDRLKEEFERLEKAMNKRFFWGMSLEEIAKTLVSQGATCIMCHTPFRKQDIESYNHSSGIDVKGCDKPQWVYMTCRKCLYQSALWKILRELEGR